MINSYYLLINNEKTGPYTQYELMDMDLDVNTLILSPLADDWQEMSDLPEFAYYFENRGIYLPRKANLASFWWRLLAYIIDYIMIIIGAMILGVIYFTIKAFAGGTVTAEDNAANEGIYNILGVALMIIYHSVCEATTLRGGIGKVACKLSVVDVDGNRLTFGKAFSRNAGKLLSSLVLGIGFLRILWDDHNQAWHDSIAKTYVIRRN